MFCLLVKQKRKVNFLWMNSEHLTTYFIIFDPDFAATCRRKVLSFIKKDQAYT